MIDQRKRLSAATGARQVEAKSNWAKGRKNERIHMKSKMTDAVTGCETANAEIIALGGTLQRYQTGWRWKDGTDEPRVKEVTLDEFFNFTMRDGCFVEVPVFKAEMHPALSWAKTGGYALAQSTDPACVHEFLTLFPQRRKEQIAAFLVPLSDWKKQASAIVGLRFAATDIPCLAAKARNLGYDWPMASSPARAHDSKPPELSNRLEQNELKLMADALNGINLQLIMDDHAWNDYTTGSFLLLGIRDAMFLDRLDLKWEVDAIELLNKLESLPSPGRRALILGIAEFWNRCSDNDADAVFGRLADELNS